jgi:DNA polymerase
LRPNFPSESRGFLAANLVNNLRGSWYEHNGSKVRVTFHPAYLLRNPAEKDKAWEDFQEIKKELDK